MKRISTIAKVVGHLAGITNTIVSGVKLYEHPSWSGAAKFLGNLTITGLSLAERINPVTGIITAILDVTGGSDWLYNKIGKALGD